MEQISCVNKEVEKYNRRTWKHIKVFENTEVIKVDLDVYTAAHYSRQLYSHHSQHSHCPTQAHCTPILGQSRTKADFTLELEYTSIMDKTPTHALFYSTLY